MFHYNNNAKTFEKRGIQCEKLETMKLKGDSKKNGEFC